MLALLLLGSGLLLLAANAQSAELKWKGGRGGDWGKAANWDSGAVPKLADDAKVLKGGPLIANKLFAVCKSLDVGGAVDDKASCVVDDGRIAAAGIGLAAEANEHAEMTLKKGTIDTNSFSIGSLGKAKVEHLDGTVRTRYLGLGSQVTGDGTYTLHKGSVRADWMDLGTQGKGLFEQRGGDVDVIKNVAGEGGTLSMASSVGSRGTYKLAKGNLLVDRHLALASGGPLAEAALMVERGTTVTVRENVLLAVGGEKGTITIDGGKMTVGGSFSMSVAPDQQGFSPEAILDIKGDGLANGNKWLEITGDLKVPDKAKATINVAKGAVLRCKNAKDVGGRFKVAGAIEPIAAPLGPMTFFEGRPSCVLEPGDENDPIGLFTIGGDTVLEGATVELDIAAFAGEPEIGDSHDGLRVEGVLTLDGASLVISSLSGVAPSWLVPGMILTLIEADQIVGEFAEVVLPPPPPGPVGYKLDYTYDATSVFLRVSEYLP